MINRSFSILALAAVASLPLLAQQPASSPEPQTGASPQVSSPESSPQPGSASGQAAPEPVPSTANAPEVGNAELRPIPGELVDKLDTKNAKTGDSVIIKTTEKATTSTGVEIPKGSKIVGRVTDVEAKGTSSDNSRVTIQFDQAELKGGESMPIRSVIQSVAPPSSSPTADKMANSAPATASASGSTPTSGGAPSSGGMYGTQGSASTGSSSTSSAAPSASAAPAGPPQPGTIVARNGNIAIRTTAVPGVLLAGNVNGQPFSNAAGALLGAKQNVHLEGGTMMVVAIMTAPSGATGR